MLALNSSLPPELIIEMNHIPRKNCYPEDKIIRINDAETIGLFKKAAKSMSSKTKSELQKPSMPLKSDCKWTAA